MVRYKTLAVDKCFNLASYLSELLLVIALPLFYCSSHLVFDFNELKKFVIDPGMLICILRFAFWNVLVNSRENYMRQVGKRSVYIVFHKT